MTRIGRSDPLTQEDVNPSEEQPRDASYLAAVQSAMATMSQERAAPLSGGVATESDSVFASPASQPKVVLPVATSLPVHLSRCLTAVNLR